MIFEYLLSIGEQGMKDRDSKAAAGRLQPEEGRESVWDYPRPPRLEATTKRIRVQLGGKTIADTRRALRVLETSHPPVYYIPCEDIRMDYLREEAGYSFCEWKGQARYYSVVVEKTKAERAAWGYPSPVPAYAGIKGYLAFYAEKMDRCTVDGEEVRSQAGNFYGGWITRDIVGPFKGGPGSWGW
jgi:uncharacterized protein (DUF427 family)